MTTRFDLLVAGGRLADGRVVDIGITKEKITYVGAPDSVAANWDKRIDAQGLTLLPGVIDPHTHLNFPFDLDQRISMNSETVAAAAGGVTTVGHYPLGIRGDLVQHLRELEVVVDDYANVDVAISYPLLSDSQVDQTEELFDRGVTSFKLLRAYRPPDVYQFGGVDDALLFRAMKKIADLESRRTISPVEGAL